MQLKLIQEKTSSAQNGSYPLVPEAYDEVKASERKEMDEIKRQYNHMNMTLQNIVAIMVTTDEPTKKKLAQQLIEKGGYMPKEELYNRL